MKAVVGVLALLLSVSHANVIFCDGREDEARCYGVLGGTLVLRLVDSALNMSTVEWTKGRPIVTWTENSVAYNRIGSRATFTPSNGTYVIRNLTRTDDGSYVLFIYDAKFTILNTLDLHLTVQAPVSPVLLITECLPQGERRASCSSEDGDSPEFSWTLDGQTVTDAQLHSGNSTGGTITLKQNLSGYLRCSVSNHISRGWRGECVHPCGELSCRPVSNNPFADITFSNTDTSRYQYLMVIVGPLASLVILLLGGVALACYHKIKRNNTTPDRSTSQTELLVRAAPAIQGIECFSDDG